MPRSEPADDLVLRPFALRLLSFIFLFAVPVYAPDAASFSRAEYADLRELCGEIENAAEGKPYTLVGVGSSPSAVLALFRALDRSSARQLSLSHFDHGQGGEPALAEEFVPRLFKHFDDYLPTDAEAKGKRVLVVDFVGRGLSMKALDVYLQRYLKERNRSLEVRFVALHLGIPPPLPEGTFAVHVKPQWMQSAFVSSRFGDFALRGTFDVRRQEKPKPGTGRFSELRDALHAHVAVDPAFKEPMLPNRLFPAPSSGCGATISSIP